MGGRGDNILCKHSKKVTHLHENIENMKKYQVDNVLSKLSEKAIHLHENIDNTMEKYQVLIANIICTFTQTALHI